VLVTRADSDTPVVKVFNWQVGVRDSETASSGTTHVEELVEDKSLLYLAPEAGLTLRQVTPAADVFSLGTIAYPLFAGRSPATSLLERANQLREHKGFNLAAVLDGAGPKLCELVRYATHPDSRGLPGLAGRDRGGVDRSSRAAGGGSRPRPERR
jgi:hypothetical protein